MMALGVAFLNRVPWAPKLCDWQKGILETITLIREGMRSGANKQINRKGMLHRINSGRGKNQS